MRKILFFLFIVMFPFVAHAQHFTLRVIAGHNIAKMKSHPIVDSKISAGQVIGLALGYKFNELIRGELETSYRTNTVHTFVIKGKDKQFEIPAHGKLESCSILGNAIFTLPWRNFFQPYAGIGVGTTAEYANWSTAIVEDWVWFDFQDGKRLGMSYQIIAGAHIPAYEQIYCGIEFRMLDSILDHMCCCNRTILLSVHKEF